MPVNSYDIDGVIYLGKDLDGIRPGPYDVIITGRSFEEEKETIDMLRAKGIHNPVFFNPLKFDHKTRESSGIHKATIIRSIVNHGIHFEDDFVQIDVIRKILPDVRVVHVNTNGMINLENERHL
jgi:hypothetical protein